MRELPSGTVTFLFSDIEGSTRLLRELGDTWGDVIREHNRLLREAIAGAGGGEVDRQGDAFFAVFPRARAALAAAARAQRALDEHDWPGGVAIRVRMGLHTGEPGMGDEGYLGLDVVRAARICSVASGGQVLVSETTAALVRGDRLDGLELRDAGAHLLKDFDEPERLFELVVPGLDRAPVPPRATAEPEAPALADWGGDTQQLVSRALETVRGLDLSELEQLGPRIERQVAAAIPRGASVSAPSAVGRPLRRTGAAVAVVLVLLAAIAVIVVLLLVRFL